jgi:hypothetical protein
MLSSAKNKRQTLIDTALKDPFFEPIIHELIDYGYEVSFPVFGGAGAYHPHALTTERLDTPEKKLMFTHGFSAEEEVGTFKAKIRLTAWFGRGGNVHSFLHEVMHFYQDTLGLFLVPLKEQGVLPVMADLRSSVMVLLFCEAWAEVEALRTCWALKHRAVDDRPWAGALRSPDWGKLAKFYDERMAENRGEAYAAARTFEEWYKGSYRTYYERHAYEIYMYELERLTGDVEGGSITEHLRHVILSDLLLRIPKDKRPSYFAQIDWTDEVFCAPACDFVLHQCADAKHCYWVSQNENWGEIKCASPPYLWKRLRMAEIEASEVPPQSTMEFEAKN